jgi:hypothetical protein
VLCVIGPPSSFLSATIRRKMVTLTLARSQQESANLILD